MTTREKIDSIRNSMPERILRPVEVCAFLSISPATLWRAVKSGRLVAPLKISQQARGWRFSDVENYLQTMGI